MSRSINTGLTVLIMLFVLLLFGGESIYNFVLAMLVGIASGLYSSIFNASMVLTAWNAWEEKKRGLSRATRGAAAAAARSTGAPVRAPSTRSVSTATPAGPTPRRNTFASASAASTTAAAPTTSNVTQPLTPSDTSSADTAPLPNVDSTVADSTVDGDIMDDTDGATNGAGERTRPTAHARFRARHGRRGAIKSRSRDAHSDAAESFTPSSWNFYSPTSHIFLLAS
jgi:hypothetical protein